MQLGVEALTVPNTVCILRVAVAALSPDGFEYQHRADTHFELSVYGG